MKGFFIFVVILNVLLGTPAAADFAKGLAAAERGDYTTALKEWRPLAEQGNPDAQYNLGIMYRHGEGVTQDYKVAIKWFKLAAEQGNASAQSNLGAIYDQGLGITQDSSAAFKWFKLAAESGNGYSRFILGEMYQQGRGVTRDYIRAHMWWNIAASNELATGLELARREFVKIQKDMTPAEVSEAQQLARECVAKNYKDC
jgi:hypothetical protein